VAFIICVPLGELLMYRRVADLWWPLDVSFFYSVVMGQSVYAIAVLFIAAFRMRAKMKERISAA
jgi:hypothetical protein